MLTGSAAVVSAALLRLAVGDALFYDASVRTEARAWSQPTIVGEVEANPRLGLALESREYSLAAAYFPALLLQDQVVSFHALHRASVTGAWRVDPPWQLNATAAGAYGTNNLLVQQQTTAGDSTRPQSLPSVTTVPYASASLVLGMSGRVDPLLETSVSIGGFIDGGSDSRAQTSLPLQRGGTLAASLDWTVSRNDVLVTRLNASVTSLTLGTTDAIGVLTETWRHTFVPDLQAWITGGPAVMSHRTSPSTAPRLAAHGEAGVASRIVDPALEGSLILRAAPLADRITGAVYERGDVDASLSWRPTVGWLVKMGWSGGLVLDGDQSGQKLAQAEGRITWSERDSWEISVGMRGVWQEPGGLQMPSFQQWGAFLAVTGRTSSRI
jgi:hypothetical protein